MKNLRQRGFTLIEMAIVMVVISAIIGGIVLGTSLITTSKLQTIMTDVDSFNSAVANFKQTYQGLPGDFINATSVWGTDSATCPTGGGTSGTCNGTGYGQITNTNGASKAGEPFLFWQHLFLAKMLAYKLSNQAGSGGADDSQPKVNVPAGSLAGTGYSVKWWGTVAAGDADRFSGSYGNIIQFGTVVSGNITRGLALTADQASAIDAKLDDGSPSTGTVRAYQSTNTNASATVNPNCVSSATTYNVSATSPSAGNPSTALCSLIFVEGF